MSSPYHRQDLSPSKPTKPDQMIASKGSLDEEELDPKDASSNYEALFDSGYNSNMQSKSFLDESDLDSMASSQDIGGQPAKQPNPSKTSLSSSLSSGKQQQQAWSDSGVSITDSGLSITGDELFTSETDLKAPEVTPSTPEVTVDASQLPRRWLKQQNHEGDTLLHLAIIEDLQEVACSIIENIPSESLLNSYNYLYQTPLHLAVLKRQTIVVQQLVSRGVSLTFQDNQGNTPLHLACKYSLTDILRTFLGAPGTKAVTTEMRNYDGDTCLHLAAYSGSLKSLELLLRAGANVNAQEGKSGKTILHWAVETANLPLVTYLLKKSLSTPDVSLQTFSGQTPLHSAWKANLGLKADPSPVLRSKSNKIVQLLLERSGESKVSLESLYSDSESDAYTSDEEED